MKDNLLEYMELIDQKKNEGKPYLKNLLDFENVINLVRDIFGDYLMDLQRSDKMFIKGQSLLHPSIGSATKLLFFSNQYINHFAEAIEKIHGSKNKYYFVIISGGVNETNVQDVFWKLKREKEISSFIIIRIPEVSLYDISGSMFRLLHECLHYCGNRHREERADNVYLNHYLLFIGRLVKN